MAEMNEFSDQKLEQLAWQFLRVMRAGSDIFGPDAFRKRYRRDAGRHPINKALFEAWSINLSRLDDEKIQFLAKHKEIVQEYFIKLMNEDRTFENSISLSTGGLKSIEYRFQAIEKLIAEVLHDSHIASL
jgi:hypothetical protein